VEHQPNPKIVTLKTRAEFRQLERHGNKAVTSGIILVTAKKDTATSDTPTISVGYIVTKKTGNAIIRNRIKRRFRALVREILVPHADPNYLYLFIGRKATIDRKYAALEKDLRYGLHNLECFINNHS